MPHLAQRGMRVLKASLVYQVMRYNNDNEDIIIVLLHYNAIMNSLIALINMKYQCRILYLGVHC